MSKLIQVLILLCVIFSSCTSNNADAIAKRLQSSQTIAVPGIGEINAISAEGDNLILTTDASARHLNYDIIKKEDSKHMIGDNAIVAIFSLGVGDAVLDSNINLVFRFQWNDGKHIDVIFSHSELMARAESIRKKTQGY